MNPKEIETIATAHYADFNLRNIDAMLDRLGDQVEWVNVTLGSHYRGREGVRDFLSTWTTALPDVKVRVLAVWPAETFAAVEFVASGTHRGPLFGPWGVLPSSGKTIEVPFFELLRFKDDKIVSGRVYYDAAAILLQALPEATHAKTTAEPVDEKEQLRKN